MIRIALDDPNVAARLPAGTTGEAAMYTEHVKGRARHPAGRAAAGGDPEVRADRSGVYADTDHPTWLVQAAERVAPLSLSYEKLGSKLHGRGERADCLSQAIAAGDFRRRLEIEHDGVAFDDRGTGGGTDCGCAAAERPELGATPAIVAHLRELISDNADIEAVVETIAPSYFEPLIVWRLCF